MLILRKRGDKMNDSINYLDKIKYPQKKMRLPKQVNADIKILLSELRQHVSKGIHLGAGSSKIPGLINCDLYNPDAELKADATNLSMFDDGTLDWIESHHMIEHLSFKDAELALDEWSHKLRKGGLVILTFPDISAISFEYAKYSLLYPIFPQPEKLDYMVKMIVGSQEHDGMFHKNGFDGRRMSQILSKYGFDVEFTYHPFPRRTTPSRLVIARKR